MENLERELLNYKVVREFLVDLKKELGGDKEANKVAELRRLEQESKTIEEFVAKV